MMKKVLFAAISRVSRQQLSSLCRRRQCSRSAQGAIAAVIDYYWPTQLALKCAFGLAIQSGEWMTTVIIAFFQTTTHTRALA
jgi:hypothetical protein